MVLLRPGGNVPMECRLFLDRNRLRLISSEKNAQKAFGNLILRITASGRSAFGQNTFFQNHCKKPVLSLRVSHNYKLRGACCILAYILAFNIITKMYLMALTYMYVENRT